jgi:hypothetical protein
MKDYAETLDAEAIARGLDEVERFEGRLLQFAKEHESEIQRDPVLRARMKSVADTAGVDIMRCSRGKLSKVFGRGSYSSDLAARIVEYCMAEARISGSLVPLPRVMRHLRSQTPDDDINHTDVARAMAGLEVFGPVYTIVQPEKGVHDGFIACKASPSAADVARLVALAIRRCAISRTNRNPSAAQTTVSPTSQQPSTLRTTASTTGAGQRGFSLRTAGASVVAPALSSASKAPSMLSAPPQGSRLTAADVTAELQWTAARATEALAAAVDQADIWVDDADGSCWFPAAWASAAE